MILYLVFPTYRYGSYRDHPYEIRLTYTDGKHEPMTDDEQDAVTLACVIHNWIVLTE